MVLNQFEPIVLIISCSFHLLTLYTRNQHIAIKWFVFKRNLFRVKMYSRRGAATEKMILDRGDISLYLTTNGQSCSSSSSSFSTSSFLHPLHSLPSFIPFHPLPFFHPIYLLHPLPSFRLLPSFYPLHLHPLPRTPLAPFLLPLLPLLCPKHVLISPLLFQCSSAGWTSGTSP
jgi:hypothetical protein